MENFTLFLSTEVSGLGLQLGYVPQSDGGKTAVFIPSVPARKGAKGKMTEVTFSRRSISAINKSLEALAALSLPEPQVNMFCQTQIASELGADIAAGIETGQHHLFLQQVNVMLEHYDEAFDVNGGTVNKPENGLASFLAQSFGAEAILSGLSDEAILEAVHNTMNKAVDCLMKKEVKDDRFVLRSAKK